MATRSKKPGLNLVEVTPERQKTGKVMLPEERDPALFDEEAMGGDSFSDATLQSTLLELGSVDNDAQVSVYRIAVENGVRKELFLYECPPAEFSRTDLQSTYGPGTYRVKVYGKHPGSNYKVLWANPRLYIGEPPGAAKEAKEIRNTQSPVPAAQDIGRLVAEAVAGAMAPLANALNALASNQGGGRREVLGELKELAGIMGIVQPTREVPQNDPMQMVSMALEFAKAMQPAPAAPTEDDIGPNSLLFKGLEMFTEAMKNARAMPAQPMPQAEPRHEAQPMLAPPMVVTQAAPVASAATAQPVSEGDEIAMMAKMFMQRIVRAAQKNEPADGYAEEICQYAPDDVLDALEHDPQWFERLVILEPACAPFRPWFAILREKVVALLSEESSDGDTQPAKPAAE